MMLFGFCLSIKKVSATSHTQPCTCPDDSYGTWPSCLKPLQLIFHLKRHNTATYINQPIACNLLKGVHLSIPWPANQQAWLSSTHAKALLENMHPVLNPIVAGPFCLAWIKTEYVFFFLLSTCPISVLLTHCWLVTKYDILYIFQH